MCIIVIQPEGYMMTEEQLLDFIDRNPHGFGFMWADNNGLHMKKIVSEDPEKLIDFYNKHAAGKAGVLHYRFATSGPVNEAMAHPFKVSDDLFVVHNGVLRGGSATESDTAQFVREVLQPYLADDYTRLYEPEMQKWIESQIGGSALVFLDRDGVVTKLGNRGVDWDSCWYSNTYAWTVPPELGGWSRGRRGGKSKGDPRLQGGGEWWDEDTPAASAPSSATAEEIAQYVDFLEPSERLALFEDLSERLDELTDEEIGLYLELEEAFNREGIEYADVEMRGWSDDPDDVSTFLLDEMERERKKPKKNPRGVSRASQGSRKRRRAS